MSDPDPMEVEKEQGLTPTPAMAAGLAPQAAAVSSLEDTDAVEEDDLLANNPDAERDALRNEDDDE